MGCKIGDYGGKFDGLVGIPAGPTVRRVRGGSCVGLWLVSSHAHRGKAPEVSMRQSSLKPSKPQGFQKMRLSEPKQRKKGSGLFRSRLFD
jgi:hypothetical protein